MKIYLVIVNDSRCTLDDPLPEPFSAPELAIDYAREWAATHATDEVIEETRQGLVFYASYSDTEDSVWVAEKALDNPPDSELLPR